MSHVLDLVRIVVEACRQIGAAGKRVKYGVTHLRFRSNKGHDLRHRDTAPFGHARPPLNAVVLGDLFRLGQRFQRGEGDLLRMLDEAADLEFEIREISRQQSPILRRGGTFPFDQKYGEMSFSVNSEMGFKRSSGILSHPMRTYVYTRGTSDLALLDRAAKAMDVALDKAWEAQRERRGRDPGEAHHGHAECKKAEAAPGIIIYATGDVIQIS